MKNTQYLKNTEKQKKHLPQHSLVHFRYNLIGLEIITI